MSLQPVPAPEAPFGLRPAHLRALQGCPQHCGRVARWEQLLSRTFQPELRSPRPPEALSTPTAGGGVGMREVEGSAMGLEGVYSQ